MSFDIVRSKEMQLGDLGRILVNTDLSFLMFGTDKLFGTTGLGNLTLTTMGPLVGSIPHKLK